MFTDGYTAHGFIQEKPNVKIGIEDEKLAMALEHVERKDWKFNFAKTVY